MKHSNLVSVIIPCHDKGDTVARSIKSVVAQDFLELECIVVLDKDDSSTGVVEQAIGGDERFSVYSVSFGNVADTRNFGIEKSNGKYICCLDADDEIAPSFIRECLSAFTPYESIGVVYTGITAHNGENEIVSSWPPDNPSYDEQLLHHNQVPTCCVFKKEAWRRVGGYKRRYCPNGAGSEDAALWTAMGAIGYKFKKATTDGLFHYYMYQGNVSGNANYQELDWLGWYPYASDRLYPFFSTATPMNGISHIATQYDEPIVSIVIPVGDGHEKYLSDAIDSVEAQSFRQWEIIVVDDTGYSGEKLAEAFGMLHDAYPFARVVKTEGRKGAGFARNRGVEAASGDFILFLDADDMMNVSEPNAISDMLLAWSDTGSAVYSDYIGRVFIDDIGKISGRKILGRTNDGETWLYHSAFDYNCKKASEEPTEKLYIWNLVSTLFPRQWHFEIGGFDEDMLTWEDWDYWLRMAKSGKCFTRIKRPYLIYRFYTGTRRDIAHKADINGRQIADSMLEYMVAKHKGIFSMACQTCGGKKDNPPVIMSSKGDVALGDNYKLVAYTHPNIGRHSVTGVVTKTRYGYHRGGGVEKFMVHIDDINSSPHLFRVIEQAIKKPEPVKKVSPPAPKPVVAEKKEPPKRKKKLFFSLKNIPGIGNAAAKSLIKSGYTKPAEIASATVEELSQVRYIGKEKAVSIKAYVAENYM